MRWLDDGVTAPAVLSEEKLRTAWEQISRTESENAGRVRAALDRLPDHDEFRREPVVQEVLFVISMGHALHPLQHKALTERYNAALVKHGLI